MTRMFLMIFFLCTLSGCQVARDAYKVHQLNKAMNFDLEDLMESVERIERYEHRNH